MKKISFLLFSLFGWCAVIAQNAFFSEDFSTFTWTKQTMPGGVSTDSFQRYTTMRTNTFGIPALNSTTGNNGWMIFDSDGSCSGNQHVRVISPSFSCSSRPTVQLCFEQWYRRFYDSTFVDVSNDGGLTWRSFVVNDDYGYPQSSPSTNPQRICLDITNAAANQPDVRIAFRFKSLQTMNSQAGCCYAWSIDDIIVDDGLNLNTTLISNVRGQTNFFTPLNMVEPIVLGARITTSSLANYSATFKVDVYLDGPNGDDALLFRDSIGVNSLLFGDIYFPNTFTPSKIGHYNIKYSLYLPNNQIVEKWAYSYVTKDFLGKSHDAPSTLTIIGSGIPSSSGGTFDQTKLANLFYYNGSNSSAVNSGEYCNGITFGIYSPSSSGTGIGLGGNSINVFLSKWDDMNGDSVVDNSELFIVGTGNYVFPAQMTIDSVHFIHAKLYDVLSSNVGVLLESNTYYIYGVEYTEPYSTVQLAYIAQGHIPAHHTPLNPFTNQIEYPGLIYQVTSGIPVWDGMNQSLQRNPLCIFASITTERNCPRTFSIGSTDSKCGSGGTGSLNIVENPIIGSVSSPNQYNWDGPNGFTSNSGIDITGLQAGTYYVTTTQSAINRSSVQSCVFVDTLEIELIPWSTPANIIDADCSQNNGRIELILPANSNVNLSFLWSNGETTQTITGLAPGVYRLTLTDGVCTTYNTYRVTHSAGYNWFTSIVTDNICGQNNGAISLTFNPSFTTPLNVAWSNGQTGTNISGLAPGGFTVTVTAANNCIVHRNIYVQDLPNCVGRISGKVLDVSSAPQCTRSNLHSAADAMVSLYDLSGNIIARQWTRSGTFHNENYNFSVQASGTYILKVDTFGQTVNLSCNSFWTSSAIVPFCGDLIDTIVLTLGTSQTRDFFFIPAPNQTARQDLAVMINSSRTNARPVVNQNFYITVYNHGSQRESGTVVFNIDSLMNNITNIGQGGVFNNQNRTIRWNFNQLAPNRHTTFSVVMDVDTFVNLGGMVVNSAYVTSNGAQDICPTNNYYAHQQFISNSYDPNDKSVSPPGPILPDSDPTLTYTIRFQNTGNDTAYIVRIKDTLDASKFDLNSIVPISSSHSYRMSLDRNILTFTFANINLVDSFTNEPASNGYIQFSIRRKPTLMIGESIQNRAAIYFDYNRPIITNTASTSIVSGIGDVLFPNYSRLQIFPNPTTGHCIISGMEAASQIEVFDLLGKLVYYSNDVEQNNTNGQSQIDLSSLPQGVYIVKAGRAYGKLVKM